MKNLQQKVAVITGAASGIGRALALLCAMRGARLALCDVDERGLEETANMIEDAEVLTATVDVSKREQMEVFRDQVVKRYGHANLLVNNAGVAVSQTVEDLSYEDFEWIMGINFWGVVYGSKVFLPVMKNQLEAAIVNVSSVFGLIGVPTQSSYNASKFAVRGFTEALRHELDGGNIHVMCVHPGGIKTNIAKSARLYVGPGGIEGGKAGAEKFEKLARTTPEDAAKKILSDLARRKGRCLIGADAVAIDTLARSLPESYWRVAKRVMSRL